MNTTGRHTDSTGHEDATSAASTASTAHKIRVVLERTVKVKLLIGAVISTALALLDSAAVVLVLPLVNLAAGADHTTGAMGSLWRALGEPGVSTFGIVLVALVVGLFIVKDVVFIAFTWWQSGVIANERVRISTQIFRNVLQSDYVSFRNRKISDIMAIMSTAVGQTMNAVVGGITQIFTAGITILALLAVLVIATPIQALVAIVYFSVAALIYMRFVRARLTRVGEGMLRGSLALTYAQLQGLNGFKEVKLRHTSEVFVEKYTIGADEVEQSSRRGNFISGITKYIMEILFILGMGVLLTISFLTGGGAGAVGALAIFVAAGFRMLPNISALVGAFNSVRVGRKSLDVVYAELNGSVHVDPETPPANTIEFSRELELRDVRYAYPSAQGEVIKGVNLTIPFGSSVAFVGSSGAGKTTMVDIILGLTTPTHGTIHADGVDVSRDIRAWQRNCAMVAQDVFLVGGALQGDIVFDELPEHVNDERLQRAVRDAQLEDVVAGLDGGLEGDIGEFGSKLSGGQKQRVGIARALYRAPRLLVLDEATSALDNETERKVTDTINALRGQVTVVIVAHRLSTVKNADTIVFMKDGVIAGAGPFAELRASNPDFARLVELGDLSDAPSVTAAP
ncbi:MAG: ABC transporter ATP-binding protein [Dermabacter sp.]|nr:ABC transporter ATP-binding protein [Dermabacter sp.]